MTVLQALDRYYDRMAARGEAEEPGWSREKISFVIALSPDGEPADVLDWRETSGKNKKLVPRLVEVPAAVKRTAGIKPNLLWDKTSYVFGRTAGEGRRAAEEHEAFKTEHLELLAGANDEGFVALRRFLEAWTPQRFDAEPFKTDMLDANIVFQLMGENRFIHEREAARRLIAARLASDGPTSTCLITGTQAPVARLHPSIKGVDGAQSSGASLVSFNLDAFESYGHSQGENAPTSEAAAFRYGAALNRMLDRSSRNRLARRLGDATVVFWADASSASAAEQAEDLVAAWFGESLDDVKDGTLDVDEQQVVKVRDALKDVRDGRPNPEVSPELSKGVRFYVLGLSPNAARLSVRWWLDDDFGLFASRLLDHDADLAIAPRPWRKPPPVNLFLAKTTALQQKFENVPPLLAGEVIRSILTGARYPRSLLAAVIIRLRAGDDPGTGWHAAAIRAVLARERRLKNARERDWLMSLEKEFDDPAYQLGRMFAALEMAQRLALGKVNASIRDRYFGAASATPASVFPLLLRGVQSHLGKLRKDGKGGWIEREIEEISDRLPPALPRSLRLDAQGRFAIGYYHQRKAQFAGRSDTDTDINEEGGEDE
jgi:CRISPR-associated protein Csd1